MSNPETLFEKVKREGITLFRGSLPDSEFLKIVPEDVEPTISDIRELPDNSNCPKGYDQVEVVFNDGIRESDGVFLIIKPVDEI